MSGKFTKAVAITGLALVLAGAGLGIGYATNKNFRNNVNENIGVVDVVDYQESLDYAKILEERINNYTGQITALNDVIIGERSIVRDRQAVIDRQTLQIEALQADILTANNNITTLQHNIEVISSVIDERNAMITNLQHTVDENTTAITNLQNNVTTLNTTLTEKNELIATLSTENETLQYNLTQKNIEIETKQAEILSLSQQIDDLTAFVYGKYYNAHFDSIVEVFNDGTVKFYTDDEHYSVYNYTSNGNTITVALEDENLEDLVYTITSNMSFENETTGTYIYVTEELQTLINDRHFYKKQVDDLSSQYTEQLQIAESTGNEIEELENQITELQSENEQLNTQITSYENQITALNTSLTQVNSQLETALADKEELQTQLSNSESEKATLQIQLDEARARVAELETQVADLRNQLNNYQTIQRNIDGATLTFTGSKTAFIVDNGSWEFYKSFEYSGNNLSCISYLYFINFFDEYQINVDNSCYSISTSDKRIYTLQMILATNGPLAYRSDDIEVKCPISFLDENGNDITLNNEHQYKVIDLESEYYSDEEVENFVSTSFTEEEYNSSLFYCWNDGSSHFYDEQYSNKIVKSVKFLLRDLTAEQEAQAGSGTDIGDGADLG